LPTTLIVLKQNAHCSSITLLILHSSIAHSSFRRTDCVVLLLTMMEMADYTELIFLAVWSAKWLKLK
jgi:hypothetical protein